MTDVTQQLAMKWVVHDGDIWTVRDDERPGRPILTSTMRTEYRWAPAWSDSMEAAILQQIVDQHNAALTAFEASRAAPAEDVDGVLVHARNVVNGRQICDGCAGTWALEELRARPGTISCCPERKMRTPTFAETMFARAALSAMQPRDEGLEALRELLDKHDKACGATKYEPSTQRPAAMHMYELQRQTFAAMYAYVRNKLAATERGEG